jgi:mevalonate pyrophosphate decarboxylase
MGVVWVFRQLGVDVPGVEIALDSNVPLEAGLSSSAALTAVTAVAINDISNAELSASQLAQICLTGSAETSGDTQSPLCSRPKYFVPKSRGQDREELRREIASTPTAESSTNPITMS